MAEEFKQFPTLVVASALSGVALEENNLQLQDVIDCASWLLGYTITAHEFINAGIRKQYLDRGYNQFPSMPREEEAERHPSAVRQKALDDYGPMLSVKVGDLVRDRNPLETLAETMGPGKQVIGVIVDG